MSQGNDNNNNDESESESKDFITIELADQVIATNHIFAETTESVLSIDIERLSIASSHKGVSSISSKDEFIQYQPSRELFSGNSTGQSAYNSDQDNLRRDSSLNSLEMSSAKDMKVGGITIKVSTKELVAKNVIVKSAIDRS